MATVSIPEDQVMELISRLSREKKSEILTALLTDFWPEWLEGAERGAQKAREAARACGRDWDTMSEAERERFIGEVLHEKS